MTMTSEQPLLKTPTGGRMSQPESPQQWHGHPYVWAWNVSLGASTREYIEHECRRAEKESAPPDAVYKTRDDDPSMPSRWVTVGMISDVDQRERVREYAAALVRWADALKEHREGASDKPRPGDGQGEEHTYAISFAAKLTGVVKANSFLEATQKLTPGEVCAPSGYGVLDLSGDDGVQWHAAFDPHKGDVATTTDPRISVAQPGQEPPGVAGKSTEAVEPAESDEA
ncbi:hypothetical protein ACF06W_11210 [Streptomyces albus]|uniref:hypothetical protein n=1 Tax=Streptomyces albus TaxID=1888 RepID=UPI003700BA53